MSYPDFDFDGLSKTIFDIDIDSNINGNNDSYSRLQTPFVTTNNNVISDICFVAGTPITTNQGIISIEHLNPNIHTIRNKKIIAITQTINCDKYLVCFEKDSLGKNIPSQKTIMSKNHCILHKGKMKQAKEFVYKYDNIKKIKYSGEILYNVLLEEHEKMVVNNIICETLHPDNWVAKIYKDLLPKCNANQQNICIKQINERVKNVLQRNNMNNRNKL
jgi:hypothetical protein